MEVWHWGNSASETKGPFKMQCNGALVAVGLVIELICVSSPCLCVVD